MIKLARVVQARPEAHAVDLVMLEDGRRFSGVKVMAGQAGGDYGSSGLAVPTNTGFDARTSNKRDIIAVVAWAGITPVVLGFLHPQVSQVLFPDQERVVHRLPSDVYLNVDADGNIEVHHPCGAYIRIGESPAHEDLTGKDVDKVWKLARNTDKQVHIHVASPSGASFDIAPDGAITVNAPGNATVNAPTLTVNGDVVVSGDVTASGVSLVNHTHGGVQAGGAHSAKPD